MSRLRPWPISGVGGQYGPDWNKPITWTWHQYATGGVCKTQKLNYPDQAFFRGRYVVHGDEVTFIWDHYTGSAPETVRWSYFGGQLTFSIISVQDTGARIIYSAHPWRKLN
jgi:hypothetical protein